MKNVELPLRVRVLVLGGGIHGVGVLHDLASRGWEDVHLVEKNTLGIGTSSRSTKLIHGGLRYLQRLRDFGLVTEALRERRYLMALAPDLIKPRELLFPIVKGEGMPRWMVKAGLALYDGLAGRDKIENHRALNVQEVEQKAPILNTAMTSCVYSYWDAQTDDLALVQRVAASAISLGATVSENSKVENIAPDNDGWVVTIRNESGEIKKISALYVINATGPWANQLLEDSKINPTHRAINNKGSHLLLPDLGLQAGLFLQSPADSRIFFVLPWEGYTLIGTTEELYSGDLDTLRVRPDEVDYLLNLCNRFLRTPLKSSDVLRTFAGLRWLAVENDRNLTETSRAHIVGEKSGARGILFTIYGGKLTTYRSLSESIGDRISHHFGEFKPSRTNLPEAWISKEKMTTRTKSALDRFLVSES